MPSRIAWPTRPPAPDRLVHSPYTHPESGIYDAVLRPLDGGVRNYIGMDCSVDARTTRRVDAETAVCRLRELLARHPHTGRGYHDLVVALLDDVAVDLFDDLPKLVDDPLYRPV